LNEYGEVVIDHKTSATSKLGIFAAGDVTDEIYKQNNISAGDAVKAALSAYGYLLGLKKRSAAAETPAA
jgi:alkyl hydroperoxide reductase subunit AhpF